MGTLSVVLLVIACVLAIAAIVVGVWSGNRVMAMQAAYFQSRYGGSVDRMLAECPVDRAALVALRDAEPSGAIKAVRELRRTEPLPLTAAVEFVRRLGAQ